MVAVVVMAVVMVERLVVYWVLWLVGCGGWCYFLFFFGGGGCGFAKLRRKRERDIEEE